MTDKKSPSDNDRSSKKGKGVPTWDKRSVYGGVPIGDRMTEANNETRGTGPGAPNNINPGGKGKKK